MGPVPRRQYAGATYHGASVQGRKNPGPRNGQDVLEYSVQVKSTSPRRVGIDHDTGEFVVFDRTSGNSYHGHVRSWGELHTDHQNALIRSGQVDRRGRILTGTP